MKNGYRATVRGAATVELAILMLIIVPVFLYTLFLEDLLRHKLQAQSTVVSTPWDYEAINWEGFDRASQVDTTALDKGKVAAHQGQPTGARSSKTPAAYARLDWCDHTEAYNSYNESYDCNDSAHHKAVAAHACWDTQEAQEVGCGIDAETGAGYTDPLRMIRPFMDSAHKGGEVYCSARLSVLNYMLPQKLFSEFSDVDTTRAKGMKGDVHSQGRGASASSVYALTMETFSVVHDSWAQTTVENVDAPGSGVLQERVQSIYWSLGGKAAYAMSLAYLAQGMRLQLISPLALLPADTPFSDDMTSANVSYVTSPGGKIDNSYYPSPWMDWNNNPVQATYNARGRFYMGATREPR